MKSQKPQLYTVGDVSSMMGISAQTLRHYCNIGLLTPSYIDPETGYRYFAPEQLQKADRARYLIKCGFSLQEVKDILISGDITLLIHALSQKKSEQLQKIKDAIDIMSLIDWYRDYFSTSVNAREELTYRIQHIPKRTVVCAKWDPDYNFDIFYERFSKVRKQDIFSCTHLKRQFVNIWDVASVLSGQYQQTHIGMATLTPISGKTDDILELPEGDFYCYQASVLDGNWNQEILKTILDGQPVPKYIVTLELENNLESFQHCLHEVQILF